MVIKNKKNFNLKIAWINFLHLYQPANADDNRIIEATEKSYQRIVRALEEHPKIKFTLNITGCLIIRWQETGQEEIIGRIRKLVKKGQVELTGSAAYHPLLPLIPEEEAIRQIKENEKILEKNFKVKPKGFFLPEMAYNAKVSKIVKKLNYQWIIIDEIACHGSLSSANLERVYKDKNSGLKIIFRSRKKSSCYEPDLLNKELADLKAKPGRESALFITATDAELYGLRHEDPTAEFEKLLNNKNLVTKSISEFIAGSDKNLELVKPVASSWESTESDLKRKKPFALWLDLGNGIQKRILKLSRLAYRTVARHKDDENYIWARWHLVRGLASCTFWWASAHDFSHIYGPYAWSPDEVERGLRELIKSVRSLEDVTTRKTKIKAEELYLEIKKMIWSKHWRKYWKKP